MLFLIIALSISLFCFAMAVYLLALSYKNPWAGYNLRPRWMFQTWPYMGNRQLVAGRWIKPGERGYISPFGMEY